ncbi:Shedu anti-phage system protein SduA domain-containing protein [Dokdonia ponticola]|uniref:Shedu anti-phage system protein SduA domain-containing protein n=1 Tax=Dokdonia ponticola TaxID=2041041 RepID=A0ABV9I0W8_9FLAO
MLIKGQRDYTILTEQEQEHVREAEIYISNFKQRGIPMNALSEYHKILPNAFYHFNTIFPNNYLNTSVLKDIEKLDLLESDYRKLLDSDIGERELLNFINKGTNYNIIASLFHSGYDFGHHEAFLFKEFELTSTFKADYLLIGKASDGYSFIFVELESPYGQITLKDGEFGLSFRKGIKQVEDWDSWIEGNFSSLKLIFNKYKSPNKNLPNEFLTLDKSRIHYTVISGRRSDFNDKTYELKRKYLRRNNIKILHYDNIFGYLDHLKRARNY